MRPARRHDGRSATGGDAAAVFGLDRHSLEILAVLVSEHKFRLQIQHLSSTYDRNARRNAPWFPNIAQTAPQSLSVDRTHCCPDRFTFPALVVILRIAVC